MRPAADGGPDRDPASRAARRRRLALLLVGAVLIVATPFLPYDRFVQTGRVRMRLTRVKAGVYATSSPDEPRRLFYLQTCAAPADDTRVTVSSGWTYGRLEFLDVRFPGGEFCSGFAVFATPEDDRGVVHAARSGRLDPEQKSQFGQMCPPPLLDVTERSAGKTPPENGPIPGHDRGLVLAVARLGGKTGNAPYLGKHHRSPNRTA